MSDARIFVTFEQAGFHHWPTPSPRRAYLGQPHRHVFMVNVEMTVGSDDREVEFHDLIDEARNCFVSLGEYGGDYGDWNFGGQSCETLARKVAGTLARKYKRPATVTVSEDGECGATVVERPPS